MSDKITLEILLEANGAIDSVKKFQKETEKSLGSAQTNITSFASSFKSFGAAIAPATAAIAAIIGAAKGLGIIKDFISDGIEAAARQETALNKLGVQLRIAGTYSEEALQSFSDFADELERSTNTSDDLVLSQAAIVKAFGLTDEQTKKVIKAGIDLAAQQGIELPAAVDALTKSYLGNGKALAAIDKDVKQFTTAQLRAGEAVDLLATKNAGIASSSLNTFSGAVQASKNAFENLAEAIGEVIIKNPAVIKSIERITEVLNDLTDFIKENSEAFSKFITGMIDNAERGGKGIKKGFNQAFDPFEKEIPKNLSATELAIQDVLKESKALNKETTKLVGPTLDLSEAVQKSRSSYAELQKQFDKNTKSAKENGKAVNDSLLTGEELERAKNEYKKFTLDIEKAVASETEKVNIKRREQLKEIEKLGKLANADQRDLAEQRVKINAAADREITEIQKKQLDQRTKDIKEQYEKTKKQIESQPIFFIIKALKDGNLDANFANAGIVLGTSFLSAIKNGKEGANQLGQVFAEQAGNVLQDKLNNAIGDDALFGLGGLFKELFAFSNQSAEEIRAQTKAFVEAIPGILENTVKFAPAFIEALAEAAADDKFIENLGFSFGRALASPFDALARRFGIKSADDFGRQLASGGLFKSIAGDFASFQKKIGGQYAKLAAAIRDGISESLGPFFDRIGTAIQDAFNPFFEKLGEAFTSLFTGLGDFGTNFYNGLVQFGSSFAAIFQNAGATISTAFKEAGGGFLYNLGVKFENGLISLGETLTNFGTSFSQIVKSAGATIANGFKDVVDGVLGAFTDIKDFFSNTFKDFGEYINSFFLGLRDPLEGIKNTFNDLKDALNGSGISGAGKKAGGAIGKVFGFADGGIVPPGFPNDSYPALLTSGERIVPPGRDLPSNDGSMDVNNALLSQLVNLLKQPQVVSATAELNGRALADIVLQLNRSNARLA